MSRSKRIALMLAVVSTVLGAAVVAGTGSPADAQQTYEMKIATVAPGDGTPWEAQLQEFKRYVEGESGGRIRVRAFMGGSLGGEKALVRRTANGSLQCFAGSTAALGTLVPELNVIEAPFIFPNERVADRKLDSDRVEQIVSRALEARGFRFGMWAENGYRSWFTKERVIETPDDLRGLRMRSQEAIVHLETYRAFGASPVPIDVTNVLTSLQTGVVDGFDNTPLFAFATSWYQAANHMTTSRHSYQPGIIAYSKSWYDTLPADLQAVLDNVPDEITTNGRRGVRRMTPILMRNLARRGITMHDLSDEQRQAFADVASRVPNQIAAKSGRNGRALLRALR